MPAGSRGLPPLLVHSSLATRLLQDGSQPRYTVGRNDKADFELTDARVSWEHALLHADGSQWVLEDLNSRNGTFADSARITRLEITAPCVVHFGQPEDGPFLRFEPLAADAASAVAVNGDGAHADRVSLRPSVDTNPTTRTQIHDQIVTIGRRPDNSIVVSDLAVSKLHAQLRKTPTGAYMIVDAGSHNGTFVNGVRVHKAELTEDDLVSIGHSTFRLSGGVLTQYNDEGRAPFAAQDLAVMVNAGRKDEKTLLSGVTFPLAARSMMAVIGPAGAGKSTLLNALTGKRPATSGSVLYDNRDLYQSYDELRHRIGLVPQDSVTHDALTAQQALDYSAELRFSADVDAAERRDRVGEVLGELEMAQHAGTPIEKLSGGQKKRVNIGLELLTRPSLLFLDEPTSPLDPHLKRRMFRMMRAMADKEAADGKSVVVITHDVEPSLISMCDRLLVLAPGGRMAYFGPPREGLKYFGKADWADVFEAFTEEPDTDWAGGFQASRDYLKYVAMPMAPRLRQPPPVAPEADESLRGRRRGLLTQTYIMARRNLRVMASDRVYLGLAGGFPIVLGLVFLLMGAGNPMGLGGTTLAHRNKGATEPLLILTLAAALSGAVNSIGELVKERDIFQRERMAGISPGAYLLAKISVLGLVSLVQALLIVIIGLAATKKPTSGSLITSQPFLELAIAVVATCFVSMLVGLLISALATKAEQTFPILVAVTLFQVVFSGAAFPLTGALYPISDIFPARWGLGMLASTVNLNFIEEAGTVPDALWDHTPAQWGTDLGVLLGMGLICVIITYRRLAATGPRPRVRKQQP